MGLTKRNMLVYFKDKGAIFFSLLTSVIVLVLYLCFLKGTFEDAFNSSLNEIPMISSLINSEDVDAFINITLLVGMICSALITVPFNCLQTLVKDRENRIDYDISATPIKRWQIILSYFVSASCCACIMTGLILTAGLVILGFEGGIPLSAVDVFKAYGMVFIGAVSATAFFMTFIVFFRSTQSSGAFFGMISAASGFVIGAYIPISQFSTNVQTVCNLFPASHVTVIIRNVLMRGVMENMNRSMGGLDNGLFTEGLRESFSFNSVLFGDKLSVGQSLVYIAGVCIVCMIVMTLVYTGTYKRK